MAKSDPPLSKKEITKLYTELITPDYPNTQARGYEFERILHSIICHENLEPKSSYKPAGEQIDGSFFWLGQTFLFEAKWTKHAIPASDLYSFKGKLDGKFHTTSGLYFSYSGYSADAVDALRFGKRMNILLYQRDDIDALCRFDMGFTELLKIKLRTAGDTGILDARYKDTRIEFKAVDNDLPVVEEPSAVYESASANAIDLLVFIENEKDRQAAEHLFAPYNKLYQMPFSVFSIDGIENLSRIPVIANTLAGKISVRGIVMLLRQESDSSTNQTKLERLGDLLDRSVVPADHKITYLSKTARASLSRKSLTVRQMHNNPELKELDEFIEDLWAMYHYPFGINVDRIIRSLVADLTWDRVEKSVWYDDPDYGMPAKLNSIDDLVEYINDEIASTYSASASWEWLKEQDYIDYKDEIREYLLAHCKKKIKSVGWNLNDL